MIVSRLLALCLQRELAARGFVLPTDACEAIVRRMLNVVDDALAEVRPARPSADIVQLSDWRQ